MTNNEIYPKVSIIIPVWNPGSAFNRCVESLRSQTLEDIEMIFVDDYSTDNAMEVVRTAAAEDPRIRIITNAENVGPGVSRNTGIEAARGEYLSFVDADDYVDAFFLERLYAKAIAGHLDIVKGKIRYIKEDGTIADYPELNNMIRDGLQSGKFLFNVFSYQHQSAIYKRAWLLKHAICYGTSRHAEDVTFLLKACHRAEHFDIVEESEYFYSRRNDSLMHDIHAHTLERRLHAFQERMDYIVDSMTDDDHVSRYVTWQVYYELKLCNFLRQKQEYREAYDGFIIGFRKQVLRFPRLEKLKRESFIVCVLCDYGVALSHQPFKLPWEGFMAESYVETIREWVDFVKGHPGCVNASEKDLYRLFREAETLCQKEDNLYRAQVSRPIREGLSSQARKLPYRQCERIFTDNPNLPRPFVFIVKKKLKAMKKWCRF